MENNKPIYLISFSEYSAFLQCPHKWFIQYHLKIRDGGSEELIFGSAIHDTIESVLTNSFVKKLCLRNPKHINSVYQNKLKEEITKVSDITLLKKIMDNNLAGIFYAQGVKIFNELNLFSRFKDYEIVDVEYELDGHDIVESEHFKIQLKGFIDLVLRNKKTGKYLILDWKTSGKKWNIQKKEKDVNFYNQLNLYRCYYSKIKNIPILDIELGFFNLPRMEPQEMCLYPKSFNLIETLDFENRFKKKCIEIVETSYMNLRKAKFTTKENYCNRCFLNNPEMCNDVDEFQIPKFELTEEEILEYERKVELRKKIENEKK